MISLYQIFANLYELVEIYVFFIFFHVDAKSKKNQKKTSSSKTDKKAVEQPEAIKKLLAGTVDISPLNTPERRIGQGFGSPHDLSEETRKRTEAWSSGIENQGPRGKQGNRAGSSDASGSTGVVPGCIGDARDMSVRAGTQSLSSVKQPMENAFFDSGVTNSANYKDFYDVYTQRNSPTSDRCGFKSDLTMYGSRKIGFPSENSFTSPDALQLCEKNFSGFNVRTDKKQLKKSQDTSSEFSCDPPAFMNFKFDRKALMATLPLAAMI